MGLRCAPKRITTPQWLGAAAFAIALGACNLSSVRGTATPTASGRSDAGRGEVVRPGAPRATARSPLFLPGAADAQVVAFDVVDGLAVLEGDIVLGRVTDLPARYALPPAGKGDVHGAVALGNRNDLWPGGVVPFVVDGSVSPTKRAYVEWAIAHVNTTELRLTPRTTEDAYVVFRETPGEGCHSFLGRIGRPQEIELAGCGRGSVVHEILHAAGFYHEQSRGDRDEFVSIHWDDIERGYESAFQKRDGRGRDIGSYDYGSIMHYSGAAFSRTGQPTIVPRHAGVVIGQRDGLSSHDRAAITQLYGNGGTAPPVIAPPPPVVTPPVVGLPPFLGLPPLPGLPGLPPIALPPILTPPASASLAGDYATNRGAARCTAGAGLFSCTFQEGASLGHLDCKEDAGGARFSCAWVTAFPSAGSGRATLTRRSPSERVLEGTWGHFLADTGAGRWELVGR